jgi:succinate dehydrogenase/fumarate reductase flavoprotein subunit
MILPAGLLSAGATLHEANGTDLDLGDESMGAICAAVNDAKQAVVDARHLGDSSAWWSSVFRSVSQRTGIDMSKQTIAVEVRPSITIGGIATDEHGRAVNGAWSRWFTGLYAAGDAACTGFHGVSAMPGNQLLDALGSGAAAGDHAGTWAKDRKLSGSNIAQEDEEQANADFSALCEASTEAVIRVGSVATKLREAARNALMGGRDATSLGNSIESLEALSVTAESIHLDQHSLIANTNMIEISRIQSGIRLTLAAAQSALSREETRGSHQRTDFPEQNEDLLHHTTVDQTGATSTLGLRKGTAGNWVLAPQ